MHLRLFLPRKYNTKLFQPFYTSCIFNKIVPDNLKGKSKSSQEWLTRQLNDEYVIKSRYDSYRCRSAYKLLEIDERFKILKPRCTVVDCGAAPGSWTQVVVRKLKLNDETVVNDFVQETCDQRASCDGYPLKFNQHQSELISGMLSTKFDKSYPNGLVIAVDLRHINPIKGAIVFKESNFMDSKVQDLIYNTLPGGKADVVLSDMAPNATGNSDLDSAAIMTLVHSALIFSIRTLKKNGTFLCKVWDGSEVNKILNALNILFSTVKRVKPKASHSDSSELFLLAMGFKGNQNVPS